MCSHVHFCTRKLFVGSSGTGAPRDGSDASEGGAAKECATPT
ncbi:MAG: hypothetical protein ABW110_06240 [Steroidobacteraceae bacterium]